jgi:hypothetical protein
MEKFANKICYFSKNQGIKFVKGTYHEFIDKGLLDEK